MEEDGGSVGVGKVARNHYPLARCGVLRLPIRHPRVEIRPAPVVGTVDRVEDLLAVRSVVPFQPFPFGGVQSREQSLAVGFGELLHIVEEPLETLDYRLALATIQLEERGRRGHVHRPEKEDGGRRREQKPVAAIHRFLRSSSRRLRISSRCACIGLSNSRTR